MLEVKVSLNDLEIVSTGNAHVEENSTLKIDFTYTKMEILFRYDKNSENGKISYEIDGNVLKVIFINYRYNFGGGIFNPWKIGILNSREFFMTIYIKYVENDSKHFYLCDYIFYYGKEVNDEE